MAGIGERLSAHFVARQQARDHPRIALRAAIEQRQRAVAVAEEAHHRRHAVWALRIGCGTSRPPARERVHHHHDQAIAVHERFRRTADMAAIGQDLARDFVFEALQALVEPALAVVQAGAGQR